ncbi:MAG TPA: hypothetical protein VLF20_02435, partial [Patescibacteria group bacterium]|nr:hypothetical protein [Patescibacteria group bacterium]
MIKITKRYINKLQHSEGQESISFDDFVRIYNYLNNPPVNIVKVRKIIYLSCKNLSKIQFKIEDENDIRKFQFVIKNNFIDLDKYKNTIFSFIFFEFFQGQNKLKKLIRFFETLLPLVVLNFFIIEFSTNQTIQTAFSALLTALSIFVAVFALFTVNNNNWERKQLLLFRNGKLPYYFSVDRNITILGIFAIIFSLLGIIITPGDDSKFL